MCTFLAATFTNAEQQLCFQFTVLCGIFSKFANEMWVSNLVRGGQILSVFQIYYTSLVDRLLPVAGNSGCHWLSVKPLVQCISIHSPLLRWDNMEIITCVSLCLELVVKQLKVQSTGGDQDQSTVEGSDDEESSQIRSQLTSLLPRVKEIALTTKKSVGQLQED